MVMSDYVYDSCINFCIALILLGGISFVFLNHWNCCFNFLPDWCVVLFLGFVIVGLFSMITLYVISENYLPPEE